MSDPIYLDFNATTPIAPEVAAAMRPFLEGGFGNPSSSHVFGVRARKAVEEARARVASLLGCEPDELVFTGGGTESNNMAIQGVVWALRERGRHLVISAVEHPAVSEVCAWLGRLGWETSVVGVDAEGRVDPAAVRAALRPDTVLVSVMHANNEVGTIEPVREIAEIAHAAGALMHSDGAQAVGKIRADMRELGVDLYSVAGHKLYAPKGVGALYIKRGTSITRYLHGAGHETGRRAGTENILGIVGLGAAAARLSELDGRAAHLRATRDHLLARVLAGVPDVHRNGHADLCLPNTLSLAFPGLLATSILDALVDEVAASAGAACHADGVSISTVLQAMALPEQLSLGTIRFSTGASSTIEEMEIAARAITRVVRDLRGQAELCELPLSLEDVRLTRFTHGLGCACKLRPQILEQVLGSLPAVVDPSVLVGIDTADDAAVYRISPDMAIVGTVDFFTPIVDDPYQFGAIAAANALSDVYAMGARPLFALSLVAFPTGRLPIEVLKTMLRGAHDKAAEAGIPIIGGHSVEDPEPKLGMAVYGLVHPDRILRNHGAKVGDALLLTKALGTGVISTAAKRGAASAEAILAATRVMATLNKGAAEALSAFEIHACTDVTGFGLAGHLAEMTVASAVDARIAWERAPLIFEALSLAEAGFVPGGTLGNREHVGDKLSFDKDISEAERNLFCDAQTSGGLLVALPWEQAAPALAALEVAGVREAAIVGRITGTGEGRIQVTRSLL